MSSLYDKLIVLGFTDDDFQLLDRSDGNGPIILIWKSATAQPTQAEIDAVSDTDANNRRRDDRFATKIDPSKEMKVLIKWVADLNGVPPGQIRQQLKQIWDAMP